VARFLDNLRFTPEDSTEMSYAIQVERQGPYKFAMRWVARKEARVKQWTARGTMMMKTIGRRTRHVSSARHSRLVKAAALVPEGMKGAIPDCTLVGAPGHEIATAAFAPPSAPAEGHNELEVAP
jgi:hypothetical protein